MDNKHEEALTFGPWCEWSGGTRPVDPAVVVDVLFKNPNGASQITSPRLRCAGDFRWVWMGAYDDIVAYRVFNSSLKKPTDKQTALGVQEGGSHYKDLKIQPVEYIHANGIGFCEGNVIKYVSRWRAKGGVQDLKKARHFLDLLIELEEKTDGN